MEGRETFEKGFLVGVHALGEGPVRSEVVDLGEALGPKWEEGLGAERHCDVEELK